MLLNELATSDDKKIKKINKVLKETFGFSLASEIDSGKLNSLYTKISDDLYNLKLDLGNARSAEYMQKVLVLEGLKILIEQKKLDEQLMGGKGGRAYEKVVNWLKIAVNDACEKGDEYDEAIYDAMKAYRSSMYRFADDVIEFDLRKETQECAGELAFTENVNEGDFMDKPMPEIKSKDNAFNLAPPERWWENDPEDLMRFVYWKKGQLPPSRPSAYAKNWNNIVKKLSASNPPPADWVNPVETPEPTEQECPNCWGRKHEPSDKLEPCHRCDATGVVVEGELEEGGDRHAEHDWVNTIKKDAGMDTKPGYVDDLAGGLSLDDPEEQEDDADDYFSYRSKQKRTEMKEGHIKQLRKLLEAETAQAESLIAAKSFSQELQDMIEKLGRLVNENLPAVSEQMRDAYGADVATGFEDQVSTTLNGVMDSLRNSKQEIDNSVSTIADGGAPSNDMDDFSDEELGGGFDDELDLDGDVDLDVDAELELGDEFGGDDAVAGEIDEPLGRSKKESIKILGKKIVEAQQKLARIKAKARS